MSGLSDHFGRHVQLRTTEGVPFLTGHLVLSLAPAEVTNFDDVVVANEQVLRLDISMDIVVLM